ncbi:MAG: SBBP repeat-containing protein, partial [Candidatus Omnitrophica bacterium]|nr:SBBP repeat-containing protein [Candidatus Omnitrophota bacterium]
HSCVGNFQWAQRVGGPGNDQGLGIAVDASGNCYVTGEFEGTAQFGNVTLVSTGGKDLFVIKFNNAGELQWARQAGGIGHDSGQKIAADSAGHCYVTGMFEVSARFGDLTLTSGGMQDMFVARYNADGSLEWAHQGGGLEDDAGQGVSTDGAGNVYVTGWFQDRATFGQTELTSAGGVDAFIAKYDGAGELQWIKPAGGPGDDWGMDIAADAAGDSCATGWFSGNASFGGTAVQSAGADDIYVTRFDPNGQLQWVRTAGGPGYDWGQGIVIDTSGDCYVTGRCWN